MSRIRFLWNFAKNPRQIGSITPSSKWLCKRLLQAANLTDCECVVEYGPGTACLTRKILADLSPGAKLIAFEINKDFVEVLKRELCHPAFFLTDESAEKVEGTLRTFGFEGADYIFSGLPFTTMPPSLRERILLSTNRALKPGGKFIIYQYSLYLLNTLNRIFDDVQISFELRNIPPAFCFVCTKREGKT